MRKYEYFGNLMEGVEMHFISLATLGKLIAARKTATRNVF